MKISIIGAAGGIGQSLSLLLKMNLPLKCSLSLYDINPLVLGVATDLSHIPTDVTVSSHTGDDLSLALYESDIVFVCAGVARRPGMERKDLLKINASITKNVIEMCAAVCPNACIAMITNPINTTVPIAAEVLRKAGVYNPSKLFGVTTLDVSRSEAFIGGLRVPVVGGHSGATILPLFSQVKGASFSHEQVAKLTDDVRNAGTAVVNDKAGGGSATLSMAYAASRFCNSLVCALRGERGIVECAYVEGSGQFAQFFSQEVLLGANGIERLIDIGHINEYEKKSLDMMVVPLQKDIQMGLDFVNGAA